MQGIYNYIPEINNVSRVYSFIGIVYLQFMLYAMAFPVLRVVYFYVSAYLNMCAVPNMVDFVFP